MKLFRIDESFLRLSSAAGLNVYSMLKHETLVLTLDALEKIEERLLQHVCNVDYRDKHFSLKAVGPRV